MKNLLVLGTKVSFLIKGLMVKLEESGYNPDFSSMSVSEFDEKVENADELILYMDEGIYYQSVFLIHLADTLQRTYKMLILIGEKNERAIALQYIPVEFIENYYERPLDMELLLIDLKIADFQEIKESDKKVILSVDDDEDYAYYLRDILKSSYHVSVAYSGAQAIAWLAVNHCDLILLDYGMPVANGKTIFEMLRSEENTKDLPIIFLTGNNDKQSVMDIISLKPNDYLLKSISREELLMKLDDFFNNHSESSGGGGAIAPSDNDSLPVKNSKSENSKQNSNSQHKNDEVMSSGIEEIAVEMSDSPTVNVTKTTDVIIDFLGSEEHGEEVDDPFADGAFADDPYAIFDNKNPSDL